MAGEEEGGGVVVAAAEVGAEVARGKESDGRAEEVREVEGEEEPGQDDGREGRWVLVQGGWLLLLRRRWDLAVMASGGQHGGFGVAGTVSFAHVLVCDVALFGGMFGESGSRSLGDC